MTKFLTQTVNKRFSLGYHEWHSDSTITDQNKFRLKRSPFFAMLFCMMAGLVMSNVSFGQTGNCATSNCVSGDIQVLEVKLVQKIGNTYVDLPKSCNTADAAYNVSIQVKVDVISQTRYGFLVTGDIYFDNVKKKAIAQCDPSNYTQGVHYVYVDNYVDGTAITWKCGEKMELRNTYTAWNNAIESKSNPGICTYLVKENGIYTGALSANACKTIAPKCRYYGPNESFLIVAPLAPNFSIAKVCGTNNEAYKTYTFTSTTTGGYVAAGGGYTYQWYIGTTLMSTANSFSYTPTTGTDFDVTLKVKDNTSPMPVSAEKKLTISPESCCQTSTAPASASSDLNNTCPGTEVTLSVSGGSLGSGASWKWYTGGCGGSGAILVNTGSSIKVSPTATTQYFVRAEGTCGTTTCVDVTVSVKTNSTAPTGIKVEGDNYCTGSGSSATLTVVGGSLGTGASWVWYKGGCGTGTSVGSGTSITVSPTATATYYVRAEGGCVTSDCANAEVKVKQYLDKPSIASTTQPTCKTPGTVTVASPDNTVTYTLTNNDHTYTATNGVFSGVAPGTYTFTASKTGSCSTDGDNVTISNAPTAPDKPVVGVKTAASCSSSSIVLQVTSPLGDYEYNNNDGQWQTSVEFTIKAGEGYSIKARRKAPDTDCESEAASCAGETSGSKEGLAAARQSTTYEAQVELASQTTVVAAPNPFSDKIRFSLKSAVSGKGTLELYNMLGQKIKTVYQGQVNAGQVQTIEYNVPGSQRANLIYVFTVGGQKTSGKLIGLR